MYPENPLKMAPETNKKERKPLANSDVKLATSTRTTVSKKVINIICTTTTAKHLLRVHERW